MQKVKPKIWIAWAFILFIAGLLADYYFLHILFHEKQGSRNGAANQGTSSRTVTKKSLNQSEVLTEVPDTGKNNFLVTLQECAPEIAAQAISTPEALLLYLRKSVGVVSEEITLENNNIILPNGSVGRIKVTQSMLKDGSTLNTELHDNKVYEFQFNNQGKIISCRYTECRCL